MKFYGTKNQEILDSEPEEVVARLMDDKDYKDFPIRVYAYEPFSIAKDAKSYSEEILNNILEILDENFGDPDGDWTEPTEDMKKASLELANVIIKDYQSWRCEAIDEMIEYSREDALKLVQ